MRPPLPTIAEARVRALRRRSPGDRLPRAIVNASAAVREGRRVGNRGRETKAGTFGGHFGNGGGSVLLFAFFRGGCVVCFVFVSRAVPRNGFCMVPYGSVFGVFLGQCGADVPQDSSDL